MDFIKRLIGIKRKPSTSAQLIALPNAVVIHTEEGNIVITPQLAKDIQANLSQITKQAENFRPKKKLLLNKEDYEQYSGRSFEEDFSEKRKP